MWVKRESGLGSVVRQRSPCHTKGRGAEAAASDRRPAGGTVILVPLFLRFLFADLKIVALARIVAGRYRIRHNEDV